MDARRVIVGCDGENGEDADPYMLFEAGYPDGWLPIGLLSIQYCSNHSLRLWGQQYLTNIYLCIL